MWSYAASINATMDINVSATEATNSLGRPLLLVFYCVALYIRKYLRKNYLFRVRVHKTSGHKANVRKANVRKANVHKANVRKANVRKTNVHKTNVRKTNVHKANVHNYALFLLANVTIRWRIDRSVALLSQATIIMFWHSILSTAKMRLAV
jgi:uncharacterized protein YjbI with pentapeptide repeats